MEKEEENKKSGFHEMGIKFAWPRLMVTKLDLLTTGFDCHCWMANNVDSIATIKFGYRHGMEIKKGGYGKPLFACFNRSQRWVI